MTAAELIAYLNGFPPETPVYAYDHDHCAYPCKEPTVEKVAFRDLVVSVDRGGKEYVDYDWASLRYVDAIIIEC